MAQENLLGHAASIWQDARRELDEEHPAEEQIDGVIVPPQELRKVATWLQQEVTKFGASAAAAENPGEYEALRPMADRLLQAFSAIVGTLLSLRRGAGESLQREIRDVGGSLAEATVALGASVGTSAMSLNAGKVLDRVQHLARMSSHNRAAIRRRLLTNLAQLRDASRELQETLEQEDEEDDGEGDPGDADDDDGFGGFNDKLRPEERPLVEAIAGVANSFETVLKQVSAECMPASASPGGSNIEHDTGVNALPQLELAVTHAVAGVSAVDGLAANAADCLDRAGFSGSLGEMRAAVAGIATAQLGQVVGAALQDMEVRLTAVQAAFEAYPDSDPEDGAS